MPLSLSFFFHGLWEVVCYIYFVPFYLNVWILSVEFKPHTVPSKTSTTEQQKSKPGTHFCFYEEAEHLKRDFVKLTSMFSEMCVLSIHCFIKICQKKSGEFVILSVFISWTRFTANGARTHSSSPLSGKIIISFGSFGSFHHTCILQGTRWLLPSNSWDFSLRVSVRFLWRRKYWEDSHVV